MSTTMPALTEVLLVQLVRKYGVSNFAQIANILKQHPLLTSQENTTYEVDASTLQVSFSEIQNRELAAVSTQASAESSNAVETLWHKIYQRYIGNLKNALREGEEEYQSLNTFESRHELSPQTLSSTPEVPSSTQDSVSLSHSATKADDTPERATESLPQQDTVEATVRVVPVTDSKSAQDAVAAELAEDDNIDKLSSRSSVADHQSSNDNLTTKLHNVQSTSVSEHEVDDQHNVSQVIGNVSDSPRNRENDLVDNQERSDDKHDQGEDDVEHAAASVRDSEHDEEMIDVDEDNAALHDSTVDEIAVAFDVKAQANANIDSDHLQPAMALRKSRTRSSTLNTVMSTDMISKEETETDNVHRRGPGRTKRSMARDNDTARSSRVGSPVVDDLEAVALQKRFQSTILPVLANITTHRYASVFANPVSIREAPNYTKVVKSPVDIKMIRAHIKSGDIINLASFHRSVLHMLSNAVMYNPENSEIATMAKDMLIHVEEAIGMFRAAEDVDDTNEDRTPKRRRRNNN